MRDGATPSAPAAPAAESPTARWLRLLILEDSALDAELDVATLEQAGYVCQWERVETREAFEARVDTEPYDLILADYTLPAFDGLAALRVVRSRALDVPFIVVSGTIGEEIAIETLKAGATDYVLKTRISRLVPVVGRALAEQEERRQRAVAEAALRRSEVRYRDLFENANDIVFTHDLNGNFLSINKAAERLSGFTREEARGINIRQILVPEYLNQARRAVVRQHAGESVPAFEVQMFTRDGQRLTLEVTTRLIYESGAPVAVQGIARDITARKRAEQEKAALLEVAREISGTLDLSAVLERVQRLAAEVLPCDAVATFYWDPERQAFRMIAHHGIPPELLPHAQRLALPRDLQIAGQPVGGRTVVVNNISAEPWWPIQLHSHFPISSLIVAPLRVRGRELGALVALRTPTRQDFDAGQVQLCTGIARQLALALDAVETYRAQQEEARVSSALVRVGREILSSLDTPVLLNRLCQLTTQAVECDFSHTLLRDRHSETYSAVASFGVPEENWESLRLLKFPDSIFTGLLQQLAKDGTATLQPNSEAPEPLVWLCRRYNVTRLILVPLYRRNEPAGILTAGDRGPREPFTPRQRRILSGIGQIGSLALENASLVGELERANRLKSDFVATMSHELRTPLNIIMGYTELLREGDYGRLTVEQSDTLGRVDASARTLLDLINATLDLSRLESGVTLVELKEVAVSDLIQELATETEDVCQNPRVTLTWELAPHLPHVHTDPVKLKMILKNLIANALKFTPEGRVVVSARADDKAIEFVVADTGVGINPDVLPIIFEPVRQGESPATRRFGGVGLGLYIVHRLLDMLGGAINVESQVGAGSTFRVRLPITRTTHRAAA